MCKILRRANAQSQQQPAKRLRHNAEKIRLCFAKISLIFLHPSGLIPFPFGWTAPPTWEMHMNFLL
ncbi:MAG: hypothetical protein JSS98_20035 [Bacteroidetes bacterium]|nr:hypothetical protein [Bacteroidota bacterium]